MKIDYKEVIIQQPVYIADDGTEFSDKTMCKDYEIELLAKTLQCYDRNYNESTIKGCDFVNLITMDDIDKFIRISKYYNLSYVGIDKPGLYMYIDGYSEEYWINLDDICFNIRSGVNFK